jgi:putative nucleotidyltransferase with HDIG domain
MREAEKQNREVAFAYDRALTSWSRMIELANREPEGHTQRVTELALAIGRQLGLAEKDLGNLRRGALLHDIGNMNIPVQILRKKGALDEKEAAIIQRHPVYAYEMLGDIPFLKPAVDVVLYHHENWDGKGYPSGLKGENIPLLARVFMVADNWDALSSGHSPGWPNRRSKPTCWLGMGHVWPNGGEPDPPGIWQTK